MDLGRTERVLLVVVWAGTALLLLTPYIVTKETIFPFVVGKALYSRTLIEIVFLAWAVLAYRRAEFRPPRCWILILLGATLVVAAVSACFGISVQRSFWSTYERMQGVVDQAHWFALALVLVSVIRPAHWRILLGAQVIIGLGIALTAVGQYYGLETLIWDATARGHLRITTTLGNPIYVGGYALVNCLLAAGLFMHALSIAGADRGGADQTKGRGWIWLIAAPWAVMALLNAWVVTLAGARGPFLGLLAGVVAVGLLYVAVTRSKRIRLIGLGVAGLFAVAAVLMVASVTIERSGPAQRLDNPLLDRLASFSRSTVDTRIAAWEAGLDGFAEAPVLGWGPENFIVVFGRYVDDGVGARMLVHDHAHSKPIEEMATKGILGLVTYLALWVAILVVLLRTGRRLRLHGSGAVPVRRRGLGGTVRAAPVVARVRGRVAAVHPVAGLRSQCRRRAGAWFAVPPPCAVASMVVEPVGAGCASRSIRWPTDPANRRRGARRHRGCTRIRRCIRRRARPPSRWRPERANGGSIHGGCGTTTFRRSTGSVRSPTSRECSCSSS